MKKRTVRSDVTPLAYHPLTGDHCPSTGWWAPLSQNGGPLYIAEGSVMPAVDGTSSLWLPAPTRLSARALIGPPNA